MFKTTGGEIYHFSGNSYPGRNELLQFFLSGHFNDIIAYHIKENTIHISYYDVLYHREYQANYVKFDQHLFYEASRMLTGLLEPSIKIPIINQTGDYVSILEYEPSVYKHKYVYDGGIDASILHLYQCICLYEVNEYSYEICLKCLNDWEGTLILCGEEWLEFRDILPEFSERIRLLFDAELGKSDFSRITGQLMTMHIKDFSSTVNGYMERANKGLFSYDEIMTLLFCFSQELRLGEENPDKKFFLIDADFRFEGLMSMQNKLCVGASYAQSKGYTPLFRIVSCNDSIYSDYPGEEIWGKFFN